MAMEPSWIALKLERELLNVSKLAGKESGAFVYPRKDPIGVRTAETIYTGGNEDISTD